MKLSKNTIKVFENIANFSKILKISANDKVVGGTRVKAAYADENTFIVEAEIQEKFTHDVLIGDIHTFLGILKSYDEPNVDFKETGVIISSGDMSTRLTYIDETIARDLSKVNVTLPNHELEFTVSYAQLSKLLKSADILKLRNIAIISDGKNITLEAVDRENPSSDSSNISILDVEKNDSSCMCVFSRQYFRFIDGDYVVKLMKLDGNGGICSFQNKDYNINYFVVTDDDV